MSTTQTTAQMLADQLEGKLATLETLLDAVDRDGWHDDTHESEDEEGCPDCGLLIDEYGDDPHTALAELPLEVVGRVGRPLSILLTFGGPNIWVEHDLSEHSSCIVGYWGSDKVIRHNDDVLSRAIDYYFPELD